MFYLPPLRRLLLPTLASVTVVILYRSLPSNTTLPNFIFHHPPTPPAGIRVSISKLQQSLLIVKNTSENYLSPPNQYFYNYHNNDKAHSNTTASELWQPGLDPRLEPLFKCPTQANEYTGHLRLGNIVQNISQVPPGSIKEETRVFWNPTLVALPYWSENQYLVVSRIVTDGNHQENVMCEANVCHIAGQPAGVGEKVCTDDDLKHVGPGGGMRCANPPITLKVPPTPAEKCEGKFAPYVDIPGFHDPRIFWSGKGEPLMMVNTQ